MSKDLIVIIYNMRSLLFLWGAYKLIPILRRKYRIFVFKRNQSLQSGFGLVLRGTLLTEGGKPVILKTMDDVHQKRLEFPGSQIIWQNYKDGQMRVSEVRFG